MRIQSLGWEDPPEKEMATHYSTLAWEIPWTEERGGPQCMGSQRVRQEQVTECTHTHIEGLQREETSKMLSLLLQCLCPGEGFETNPLIRTVQTKISMTHQFSHEIGRNFKIRYSVLVRVWGTP